MDKSAAASASASTATAAASATAKPTDKKAGEVTRTVYHLDTDVSSASPASALRCVFLCSFISLILRSFPVFAIRCGALPSYVCAIAL